VPWVRYGIASPDLRAVGPPQPGGLCYPGQWYVAQPRPDIRPKHLGVMAARPLGPRRPQPPSFAWHASAIWPDDFGMGEPHECAPPVEIGRRPARSRGPVHSAGPSGGSSRWAKATGSIPEEAEKPSRVPCGSE